MSSEEDFPPQAHQPNPHRYFTRHLSPEYRRLTFPVKSPPTNETMLPRNSYTRNYVYSGTTENAPRHSAQRTMSRWSHSIITPREPPHNPISPNRFLPLLEHPDTADDLSHADATTPPQTAPPQHDDRGAAEQQKKKRVRPFQRKNPPEGDIRSYMVRLRPTPEQAKEFCRLFAAKRYAMNWLNARLKELPSDGHRRWLGTNHFRLRRLLLDHVRSEDFATRNAVVPEWAHEGQLYVVWESAALQVADAYATCFRRLDAGEIDTFNVRFWSLRRTLRETMWINRNDEHGRRSIVGGFVPLDGQPDPNHASANTRMRCLCKFHLTRGNRTDVMMVDRPRVMKILLGEQVNFSEGGTLIWDKRRRAFYLNVNYRVVRPKDPDPTWENKRVVGLDGGIRSFQTFCNVATGEYGDVAIGIRRRIDERAAKIDKVISRLDRKKNGQGVRNQDKQKKSAKQRRHDRQKAQEWREKKGIEVPRSQLPRSEKVTRRQIRNLERQKRRLFAQQHGWTHAWHYDSINFLWRQGDVIINPPLRTSQLVPRERRVFGSAAARAVLTMSHWKFNQRLRSSTLRGAGRHVIDTTGEPGTTRTCPNPDCGKWHADLGGNKTFLCPRPECQVEVDRDVTGVRGNVLAALGKACGALEDGTSDQLT